MSYETDRREQSSTLPILNKYLVIRHLDESFVNISIIKKRFKTFLLKYNEAFEIFIDFLSETVERNEDKREKNYYIVNINSKNKTTGGIRKILSNKDIFTLFDTFSFQNSLLKLYVNELINKHKNKQLKNTDEEFIKAIYQLKKDVEQQKKLMDMIVFCHQAVIGKIIGNYIVNDYMKILSYEELFQSGVFGLYLAILKYDFTKGYKFVTMAFHWIRYKVAEEVDYQNNNIQQKRVINSDDFNSMWDTNEDELTKIIYEDLIEKLKSTLSNTEYNYLMQYISKTQEFKSLEHFNKFEETFSKNQKLQDIITKSKLKLKIS